MKLLLCVLLSFIALATCDENDLLVTVKNGDLQGTYMKTAKGREFRGFMKIPFAQAPVGDLRFEAPVPAVDWTGVRDATQDMPQCPSMNVFLYSFDVEGEEDCLFLNVYAPKTSEIKKPLPVMVFIHGGGFSTGTGNTMFYPPGYLLDKDIVLVSINYRLGALGFLSTGDDVVPGNMGLKDQTMALRWVKENIAKFGGNPDSVTIFGESAGGASTHFHLISPLSKGLIHGAVSQSGAANCHWATKTRSQALEITHKLANIFDCPTESSKDMIECLKKVDGKDIAGAHSEYLEWDIDPLVVFVPVVEPKSDGAFLIDTVENSIKKGYGNDVPFMLGLTSEDGAIRTCGLFGKSLLKEFNEKFDGNMHMYLLDERSKKVPNLVSKIRKFYFGKNPITEKSKDQLNDLFTDVFFAKCIVDATDLHRTYRKSPVYFYMFSYRGSQSYSELMGSTTEDFGVCHGDDLLYLFNAFDDLKPNDTPSKDDMKMVKRLTNMWVNFAELKNPTPKNNVWKPVQSERNEYLDIKLDSLKMKSGMFSKRMEFWKDVEELYTKHAQKDEL